MAKISDLVLLIGTNPLPNYVVAKYLSDTNSDVKNIFLVHSGGNANQSSTWEYAVNIEKVFNKTKQYSLLNFKYISLEDIENQKSIINNLNSGFNEESIDENIHLNYTGGTKTMGIHVYNFLQGKYKDKFESSYLSAKTFKLVNENGVLISDDLRKKINIDFNDLLDLHGFVRKNENKEFLFGKALEKFEEIINMESIDNYFQSYKRENFQLDNGNLIEKTIDAEYRLKNIIVDGELLSINNSLTEEVKLFDQNRKLKNPLPNNKVVKNVIEFIDGEWLEEYIFKSINDDEQLTKFTPSKNWVIKKSNWENNVDFEIDVILMNGYQFYGISCTTDRTKKICKSKGFEIIMRTRQLGGDESKSILITMLKEDQVQALQKELELDTGGTSKNILILGKCDIRKDKLLKKIKHFMEVNE